jgi:hypothetical protein
VAVVPAEAPVVAPVVTAAVSAIVTSHVDVAGLDPSSTDIERPEPPLREVPTPPGHVMESVSD